MHKMIRIASRIITGITSKTISEIASRLSNRLASKTTSKTTVDSLVKPSVRPPVELQAFPDCSKFQQIRAPMLFDQLLHLEIPRADPGVRRQIFERIATLDRR